MDVLNGGGSQIAELLRQSGMANWDEGTPAPQVDTSYQMPARVPQPNMAAPTPGINPDAQMQAQIQQDGKDVFSKMIQAVMGRTEAVTDAQARLQRYGADDRVTSILKARQASEDQYPSDLPGALTTLGRNLRDAQQAGFRSAASISTTGDRKYISFGEALNSMKAQRLAEAESLAKIQIEDEKAAQQDKNQATNTLVQLMQLREQNRHNLELEKKFDDYDKKIRDLKAGGLTEEEAISVLTQRYGHAMDPFGNFILYDKANGNVVRTGNTNNVPTPSTGATVVPPNLDVAGGTGLFGHVQRIINGIAGAANFPLPAEDVARVDNYFSGLKVRTQGIIRGIGDYRPSKYSSEQAATLTVDPSDIFTGRQKALDKLQNLKAILDVEIKETSNLVNSPQTLRPAEMAKAKANLAGMRALYNEYDTLIKQYQSRGAPDPASVTPESITGAKSADELRRSLKNIDTTKLSPEAKAALDRKMREFGF